ncbi:hypothetical protein V8C35DRAFT_280322 [Trichoderma chlorosporum]
MLSQVGDYTRLRQITLKLGWIIKDGEGPELTPNQILEQGVEHDQFRWDFAHH